MKEKVELYGDSSPPLGLQERHVLHVPGAKLLLLRVSLLPIIVVVTHHDYCCPNNDFPLKENVELYGYSSPQFFDFKNAMFSMYQVLSQSVHVLYSPFPVQKAAHSGSLGAGVTQLAEPC